jgi:MFS family permease
MLKSVISIVTGILVAALVVFLVGLLGYQIYPPPMGIEVRDMQTLQILIGFASVGVFVLIISAWMLGSFVGGYCAAGLAERSKMKHAVAVGVVLMAFGVATMVLFSPPFWFWILGLGSFIPLACAGANVAAMNTKSQ